VLGFGWGVVATFQLFVWNLTAAVDGLSMAWLFAISSGLLTLSITVFALVGVDKERTDMSFYNRMLRRTGRRIGMWEMIMAFGDKWWQRFIPHQVGCTPMAWPGVDWDDQIQI
jgi:hypothetical protein